MNKIVTGIVVLLVVIVGGMALVSYMGDSDLDLGYSSSMSEDVVATVNGETITRGEFETLRMQIAMQQGMDFENLDPAIQESINSQAIENLVAQKLLNQAAARSNVVVSEDEVDAQIQLIISQFESEEQFEEILRAEGLSLEELENQIKGELLSSVYLNQELNLSEIEVSEAEVEETYLQLTMGEEAPDLSELYGQIEQVVIQERSQEIIMNFIDELRAEADVEILI